MITRRKLMTTAAATGAAAMLLPVTERPALALECEIQSKSVPGSFITITAPSDPKFTSLLNTHFPNLSDDPNFTKIRPYAVLITNVSGIDINAFSTFWQVESPTGGYEAALRHFFHPSEKRMKTVHYGVAGNKTRFTGQVPAIKAGAIRLLTPYFSWSPSYYERNPKLDWSRVLAFGAQSAFTLHELGTATAVRVSLDAVIVKQSQVVGPDKARLAKTYALMRNAEHDAAVGAINSIPCQAVPGGEISSNLDQILNYLETVGAKYPSYEGDAYKDRLYRKVRQRQATILVRRLKHATPEQFSLTLHYLASQPKTTIKQVSLA